ncbi:MAG TPA: lysine--tRNA ligase [Gammaproteobacteria bacterium]|nr:lysine--tRNA ligase [Gammaproteobacteria bacterium]
MTDKTDKTDKTEKTEKTEAPEKQEQTQKAEENRLVAERREKLRQLRARGPAFPNDFRRSALAGQLIAAYGAHDAETLERENVPVRVSGRLMSKRVMGKNTFANLQDRSGQIQLFVQRDVVGEAAYTDFKKWDIGDLVGARGKVFKTRTGELSVAVEEARLLVKSLRPLPEKWHGIADAELKLRQRYLDLVMNERTREVFRRRTQIIRIIRSFLDALDFIEVETPLMHPIPGGAAARPFETHHRALDMKLYLRIAPELYLKRLLVGGFERVYELGRVFRNEGLSTRHNPEFTMLELYQAYADYRDAMTLTERLVRETARSLLGTTVVEYQGERFDLEPEFPRKRLEDALADANPSLDRSRLRDVEALRAVCRERGVPYEPDFGPGKLQLELFEKTVEETLRGPVFITHYPAEVSPLARRSDADPFLTDRFELFIAGREMANGFSELNDPEDQAERFRAQAEAKARGDEEAMVYDEDYIRALEHGMPPAAGIGLGVDRLVMFLTDSPSIRDVLLFPQLKPES